MVLRDALFGDEKQRARAAERRRRHPVRGRVALIGWVLLLMGVAVLTFGDRAYVKDHLVTPKYDAHQLEVSVTEGERVLVGIETSGRFQRWASPKGLILQRPGLAAVQLVAPQRKDWDSSKEEYETRRDWSSFPVAGWYTVPHVGDGVLRASLTGQVQTDQGFGAAPTNDSNVQFTMRVRPAPGALTLTAYRVTLGGCWLAAVGALALLAVAGASAVSVRRDIRRHRRFRQSGWGGMVGTFLVSAGLGGFLIAIGCLGGVRAELAALPETDFLSQALNLPSYLLIGAATLAAATSATIAVGVSRDDR